MQQTTSAQSQYKVQVEWSHSFQQLKLFVYLVHQLLDFIIALKTTSTHVHIASLHKVEQIGA